MKKSELVKECVFHTPLVLLTTKDEEIIEEANKFLPFSTGFEIECNQLPNFDASGFKLIPNILDVGIDSYEQRFRIPNGVNGLICLYNICEQLKLNSELNSSSGIHYHIDMTSWYDLVNSSFIEKNSDWILKELDSWKYAGVFNSRTCKFDTNHNWVRFQSQFRTAEIRIGEMTFDYELLVKRIVHANSIMKRLKLKLTEDEEEYKPIIISEVLHYISLPKGENKIRILNLENELKTLSQENEVKPKEVKDINNLIKNRNITINVPKREEDESI